MRHLGLLAAVLLGIQAALLVGVPLFASPPGHPTSERRGVHLNAEGRYVAVEFIERQPPILREWSGGAGGGEITFRYVELPEGWTFGVAWPPSEAEPTIFWSDEEGKRIARKASELLP